MSEITYQDGEWPEVVILMLSWAGPPERKITETRFGYIQKTIAHIKKNLHYPNLSWHIADDGSPQEYQDRVLALLEGERFTTTDTRRGWDVNNNWNTGMKVAFERADIVAFWPDDRTLVYEIDLKPYVRLLMDYEDVAVISIIPQGVGQRGRKLKRCGKVWWMIDKSSPSYHVLTFGPNFRHKRYLEAYGLFEPAIWPLNAAEDHVDAHFRGVPGPEVVCPDEFWQGRVEIPWGGISTWEYPEHSGQVYRKLAPWAEGE